jgi:superfamily II DNA or RNA helicase
MAPGTPHMNLLGFHRIGAGKTITFLNCAERWLDKGKPLVILPASLIGGVRNELRGPFADYKYISKEESEELKILTPTNARYKEIIHKSDELIDRNYDIMSYNKFVTDNKDLDPPIMIIDEVHNVLNSSGTYYREIMKFIE